MTPENKAAITKTVLEHLKRTFVSDQVAIIEAGPNDISIRVTPNMWRDPIYYVVKIRDWDLK